MLKSKKKENQKIKEQYEYIKRCLLESIATDGDEKDLIDVDYYDKICVLEFNEDNKPKNISMAPEKYIKSATKNNNINANIIDLDDRNSNNGGSRTWGIEVNGGILTDSGEFMPDYDVNFRPIHERKYRGYSSIYDNDTLNNINDYD